jgi:hypothetical protein
MCSGRMACNMAHPWFPYGGNREAHDMTPDLNTMVPIKNLGIEGFPLRLEITS